MVGFVAGGLKQHTLCVYLNNICMQALAKVTDRMFASAKYRDVIHTDSYRQVVPSLDSTTGGILTRQFTAKAEDGWQDQCLVLCNSVPSNPTMQTSSHADAKGHSFVSLVGRATEFISNLDKQRAAISQVYNQFHHTLSISPFSPM